MNTQLNAVKNALENGFSVQKNNGRHVEAFRVVNYVFDLMKNNETALMNVGAMWAWGVEPIFSEG